MTETTEVTRPDWMPDKPHSYPFVMDKLVEIVSSRPEDYVYPVPLRLMSDGTEQQACSYWHQDRLASGDEPASLGEPGCIVGHLLHGYGVSRQMLIECDDMGKSGSSSWSRVKDRFPGLFTGEVDAMLQFIQVEQDSGIPWGQLPNRARAWHRGWRDAMIASIDAILTATATLKGLEYA